MNTQLSLPTINPVRRLKIVRDYDPENPRDWDNLGTMVCWGRRYRLGDEQPSEDSTEYLLKLADEAAAGTAERWENWDNNYPYPTTRQQWADYTYDTVRQWAKAVQPVLDRHYIMLELYLYAHGGLSMRTSAFSCPWDSGQVGYIYVPVAKVKAEWGWKRMSPKRRKQIEGILEAEVKTYDQYLTGDTYGFVIEEHDGVDWDEIDSCWGFFGEDIETAHAHVEHYGFTLEQVAEAFTDVWFDGADGGWVQTGVASAEEAA